MASTGRTLSNAAEMLREVGADSVDAVFTHPVLAEGAFQRLTEAPLDRIATSDSIPTSEALGEAVQVVSVAPLLAQTIREVLCRVG